MRIPLSSLNDYIDITFDELQATLTPLGLEIEAIENPRAPLEGLRVGKILEANPHPNADRLQICTVNAGSEKLYQVVCGAPNARSGLTVAFCPVGQAVPNSGIILKAATIRGVPSEGMLCSLPELGLGEGIPGHILELPDTSLPGEALATVLESAGIAQLDPVIEISVTPNRTDCFGLYGIARDLSVALKRPLRARPQPSPLPRKPSSHIGIIASAACLRFAGVVIRGVQNGPSPQWLQNRLKAAGLKVHNLLVDVTNYLCHDLGRPLHVYDLDKLSGPVVARWAKEGEQIEALDGKVYTLKDDMLVMADDQGPQSIAGIMGGAASSVTLETKNVLVECAYFDPIAISKTGQTLALLSESRTRFERGTDPQSVLQGIEEAVTLIQKYGQGKIEGLEVSEVALSPNPPIPFDPALIQHMLGVEISDWKEILERLGCRIEGSMVHTPTWRPALTCAQDLVAELLRLKGDAVISSAALLALPLPNPEGLSPQNQRLLYLKRLLATRGLLETVTYSFVPEELSIAFGGGTQKIQNPISETRGVMRPTPLIGLLEVCARNQAQNQESMQLFELATGFTPQKEHPILAFLLAGSLEAPHWKEGTKEADVYDMRSLLESIWEVLNLRKFQLFQTPYSPIYHPGRSGTYKLGNRVVAAFGELHPRLLKSMSLSGPVIVGEVFLDTLPPAKIKKREGAPVFSDFQRLRRDFSFLVETHRPLGNFLEKVRSLPHVVAVDVFDVYTGPRIETGKKSIAFTLTLEPTERTLTEEDLQSLNDTVVSIAQKELDGKLRDGAT